MVFKYFINIEKYIKNKLFITNKIIKKNKKNFFCVSMFPYPSGLLHIGHARNYIINDILNRLLKLKNYNILMCMGWDSFGLPAENAAIKNSSTPIKWIKKNIFQMKNQLYSIDFSINWKNEIKTYNISYYKLNHLIFYKLLKNKLIYLKKKIINWDPTDKTVLSNEQVINGKGWRSGDKIKKKFLLTYFIKIFKYREELLKEIFNLDWPKKVKLMQYNWIGKINGVKIKFFYNLKKKIKFLFFFKKNLKIILKILIFIISKKSFILNKIFKININFKKYIKNKIKYKYIYFKNKNKTIYYIINTGLSLNNYFNLNKIEIWLQLNKKFFIKYFKIINNFIKEYNINFNYFIFINFFLINLFKNKLIKIFISKINALSNFELKYYLSNILTQNFNCFNFWKLKDWGVSRQRYWATTIPVNSCNFCKISYILKKNLTIVLPKKLKYKINNPLKSHKFFYKNLCIKCKKISFTETDTIDTFFDSSWYFIRYISYKSNKLTNSEVNKWMPIDFYIGGIEHAILHLFYSRFLIKFIRDIKLFNFGEPIKKLYTQGLILNKIFYSKNNFGGKNFYNKNDLIKLKINNKIKFFLKSTKKEVIEGSLEKMSKSKNNSINLQTLIEFYGSSIVRLSIISFCPLNQNYIWSDCNLKGCYNFINKFWVLLNKNKLYIKKKYIFKNNVLSNNNKLFLNYYYFILNKINLLYNSIQYNNIISYLTKILNILIKIEIKNFLLLNEIFGNFIKLLYPLTPSIAFKTWSMLCYNKNLNCILNTFLFKYYNIISKKYINYFLLINNKKFGNFFFKKNNKFFLKKKIKNLCFFKKNGYKIYFKKIIFIKKNLINTLLNV